MPFVTIVTKGIFKLVIYGGKHVTKRKQAFVLLDSIRGQVLVG